MTNSCPGLPRRGILAAPASTLAADIGVKLWGHGHRCGFMRMLEETQLTSTVEDFGTILGS